MGKYLTIKTLIFWNAGMAISNDGKYPAQDMIEEYFNRQVVFCWEDKCQLQFDREEDATMFALRWC